MKFAIPTVLLAVVGFVVALWRRTASHRIVLVWIAVWYVSFLITGAKYGRYFTSVAPALFLLAAHGAVVLTRAIAVRLRSRAPSALRFSLHRFSFAACALLMTVTEAGAAVEHAPHYRLFINAFGGGDARVTWFFPHCDLFDAGLREALATITAHAEPGAEVCSETEWPSRHYVDRAGRSDLVTSAMDEQRGCKSAQPCYVIVEPGRRYWHNQRALDQLAQRTPWHVERINGTDVAWVYRLESGESLFPSAIAGAGGGSKHDWAAP